MAAERLEVREEVGIAGERYLGHGRETLPLYDGMSFSRFLPLSALVAGALPFPAAAISFSDGGWISPEVAEVSAVRVIDFNHDGRPDLVVLEKQYSTVLWLENTGNGGFRAAGQWVAKAPQTCAAVEDFDGDGNVDLLVVNGFNRDGLPPGAIRYGTGPGAVAPEGVTLPVAGNPRIGFTVQDVNGDGLPDILADKVLLNQGAARTFTAATKDPQSPLIFPGGLATAGYTVAWSGGEALHDLFAVFGTNDVIRYRSVGDGNFQQPEVVVKGDPRDVTTGLAIARLPEISDQPCLVRSVERKNLKSIRLYTQGSDGKFTLAATLPSGAASVRSLRALSDGDHDRILLTAGKSAVAVKPLELRVTRRGAKAILKLVTLEKTATSASGDTAAILDVDGDGQNDLVLAGNGLAWHAGVAGAGFSTTRHEASAPDQGDTLSYTGDLDHDGDVDLVTQSQGTSPQRVTLWLNSGHGESFQNTTLPVVGDFVGVVAVGDWDQDGYPDLLVRTSKIARRYEASTNRLLLISRLPNGRTMQKTLLTSHGRPWVDGHLIQGDADGILDFEAEFQAPDTVNHFQLYRGVTATIFGAKLYRENGLPLLTTYRDNDWDGDLDATSRPDAEYYTPPSQGGTVIILPQLPVRMPGGIYTRAYFGDVWPTEVDFDGDGHPDYLSKSDGYDTPVLARANATSASSLYPLSQDAADYGTYSRFPSTMAFYADVDGDGDADAIYETAAGIQWQENLGSLNFANPVTISGTFQTSAGAFMMADLDGDGVQDIVASASGDSSQLRWFKGGN
jgi:hypothetical protein